MNIQAHRNVAEQAEGRTKDETASHLLALDCCDCSGVRFYIEFKSGVGDFGSGNGVGVRIDRSAFVEPISSPNNRFE